MQTEAVKLTKSYPRNLKAGAKTYVLKRLGPAHQEEVLSFARSLPEENLLFLRLDITDPDVVEQWIASQETGQRITVLAFLEGRLVGYGSLNRYEQTWSRHMGEIRVIVDARERGHGLGTKLAKEIFDIAEDVGLQKIVARMVREQEGARHLFERLGFTAEALLTDWVIDRSGKTRDLVLMTHDVTSLTN